MAIYFNNWKDKFKRKKRSTKPNGHGTILYNADKHYCHWFHRSDRAKSDNLIKQYQHGCITEEELESKLPRNHKHTATWNYW